MLWEVTYCTVNQTHDCIFLGAAGCSARPANGGEAHAARVVHHHSHRHRRSYRLCCIVQVNSQLSIDI